MEYDPDYGEIKIKIKRWGGANITGTEYEELEMRPCNKDELGLGPEGFDDSKSKFYPVEKISDEFFEFYYKKLYCVD